jgi:hypothetical protein
LLWIGGVWTALGGLGQSELLRNVRVGSASQS